MKKFPIGSGLSIKFYYYGNGVYIVDDHPDYCYLLKISNVGLFTYSGIYHSNYDVYDLDEDGILKIIGVDEI
jgi:hypothetical protein